jgi:hypothetical protein
VSHTPATSAAANANLVAVGARAHENVVRFEVTVNHSVVVRMMQREGDLADDADGARWSHRSFPLHKQAELLAFEELHRHELSAADRLTEIARLDDVAVAQRFGGFVLPPEALDSNGVARNLGVKHLDCDPFTGLTMPGFVNRAHGSIGDVGEHHVGPQLLPYSVHHRGLMLAKPASRRQVTKQPAHWARSGRPDIESSRSTPCSS